MYSVTRRAVPAAAVIAAGAALITGGVTAQATAFASTSASAAGPKTSPRAASAPGTDPTITIRVGGIRTAESGPPGPPAASGLPGATFRVSPSSAGHASTCVSTAAGLCTLNVDANRTYTITQAGAPAGWFASPTLATGAGSQVRSRAYGTLTVRVGRRDVTIPDAAPNADRSPTARGGTWALSKDDPALPGRCGLRIALLMDLSGSIAPNLRAYKAAARSFVESLKGSPPTIAIYTFGTTAPAPGVNNANLAPVSVATKTGVTTLVNKIDGLTVPSRSGTNWDAGFWQIMRDNRAHRYDAAIALTDGDPTYYGPSGSLGGRGNLTRFAETENAVFSANALKAGGTSVLGVGIGTSSHGLPNPDNIRAVSGPAEGTDYFNTDFGRPSSVLAELALRNCAGLNLRKTATPKTYAHVGQKITYTYRVTNQKYFTLHGVHVTDDRIRGPIPCTPSTLATGKTATCTARYAITMADLEAGHVTNTATATGTTPNHDDVTSRPAQRTVRAAPFPAIALVKKATPTTYSAPGDKITYTYRLTNTGREPLRHITLDDNRLGVIGCPRTSLRPGQSMTCSAAHTTTLADMKAGHVVNSAIVTGYPPKGFPVADTAAARVRAVSKPGIGLRKTAFPTAYDATGERIAYTYTVANTGDVTLHGITLTDDKVRGPIACGATVLAPGRYTICRAAYIVTAGDVAAGRVTNTATAAGLSPMRMRVTAMAEATIKATLPEVPVTG
jgi:hypothetical protein